MTMENPIHFVNVQAPIPGNTVFAPPSPQGQHIASHKESLWVCPPMTVLFHQGFPAHEAYLIDSGLVKLIRTGNDGEEMILGLRSRGSILGVASMIVQKPYQVTAITLSACELRRMPMKALFDIAETDPHLNWLLHQAQSREVYEQVGHLAGWLHLSARQRFEQFIWELASSAEPNPETMNSKQIRLRLPMRLWEVAQFIGVTPEHLSRILKQVEEEGIIRRRGGYLIISDLQVLYHTVD
jgi:CRP/FNR family transcriptional regulator